MENSQAPTFSSSTSPCSIDPLSSSSLLSNHRHSLRSLTGSTPNHKRGPAPSSFIHTEASPSNTLSSSSREDQTVFLSQTQPEPREASLRLGRISIVATPRSKAQRPASIVSTKSNYDRSKNLWSQQSILKRMSWGWNQTFAGLTPDQLTEVEIHRERGYLIQIPTNQPPIERRQSIASSEHSITSANSRTSSDPASPTTANVNKPFANRRSTVNTTRPEIDIPAVVEEEAVEEEAVEEDKEPTANEDIYLDEYLDEMGLRRALSTRFGRNSPAAAPKQRLVISLPSLISSTNAQINDSMDIHPALRNSASSNEHLPASASTAPTTPIAEDTPGLTDSSSVGSSRSSTNGGSPITDRFSVSPNHLTQYFPQLAPEKIADNVTLIVGDDAAPIAAAPASDAPPTIPTRAPSHSKREHIRLSRTRSLRNSTDSHSTSPRLPAGRTSATSSRHTSLETKDTLPFATDLAQVDEIHEDFNSLVLEEQRTNDEGVMGGNGYRRVTPSVYMADLVDLEKGRWD